MKHKGFNDNLCHYFNRLHLFIVLLFFILFFHYFKSFASESKDYRFDYFDIGDNFYNNNEPNGITKKKVIPEALRSAKNNATVRIGGELFVDYIGSAFYGDNLDGADYDGGWYLHNTNLRFDFSLTSDLRASIKLDLSNSPYRNLSTVMEEALIIWDSICGGPIGLFFGAGEVPYGQDRTLGIIQSYNHTEGNGSSEGPIILSSPYLSKSGRNNVIYHPGEIDRVVLAGLTYTWEDIIKAEFAFFQPDGFEDEIGVYDRVDSTSNTGFGSFAARVWWNTPIEGLVAEISGVRRHDAQRGDNGFFGADAVEDEYAVSFGLDWNINNSLEVFAEYQHGFNWGFTEGYHTDTVSIGSLYYMTDRLSLGGMVEWLHISDRSSIEDFNKFVLHAQYKFSNGVYLIAEYGAELYNWGDALTNVFAVRSGVSF